MKRKSESAHSTPAQQRGPFSLDSGAETSSGTVFAALDVETANPDPASICQIGIATVEEGHVRDVWAQLVRPDGDFSDRHVAIHGITPEAVTHARCLSEVHGEIAARLPRYVVTHTRFDVAALTQACRQSRRPMFDRVWVDSSVLPDRAWPGCFPRGSRALPKIAARLGIAFRHHDAGEDARAAAEITLRSLATLGMRVEEYAVRYGLE